MGRYILRGLGLVALVAALVWAGDFLAVRIPLPPHRLVFSTMKVEQLYEMPLKSGRMEVDFAGYGDAVCVHALAPHFGDPPCWYLRRHPTRIICCAP